MTVQTLKLKGERYVLIHEKDYARLKKKAELLSDDEAVDVAEAVRRLNDPREKRVSWSKVKKRAGLT